MRHLSARLAALGLLALLLPACGIGGSGTLTPTIAPGIPSNVGARAGNRSVTIDWTASAAGSRYTVFRSLVPNGPFFPVSVASQFRTPTSYVDPGLLNGATYYYQVIAVNNFGSSAPSVVVSGTPGFKAVAVSAGHGGLDNLALLPDGSVWEWGQTPTLTISAAPLQVANLIDITAISCGANHNLALGSDGRIWGWGNDSLGQVGDGDPAGAIIAVPTPVLTLNDAIAVASGDFHSLALAHDGRVWVWGDNRYAQMGLGSTSQTPVTSPQLLSGLTNIIAIAAGSTHSLALRSDGLVFSWGENGFGELGNGPASGTPVTPSLVSGLNGVVAIAAGSTYSLALRNDGTVWGFGDNSQGQLGLGSASAMVLSPTKSINLTGIVAIAAGGSHSLAVKNDGTIWAFGANYSGVLGNGTSNNTPNPTPVQVLNITNAASVAASSGNSVALGMDGTVWTWGDNVDGELGNGTGQEAQIPVELPNFTGASGVACGNGYTLILKSAGTVWGLGTNTGGQIGNGTSSATVPVSVPAQTGSLTTATAIAAGYSHGLARLSTGAVYGWGGNASGQIGDGTSGNVRLSPVPVATPSGITSIACGGVHSLAIRNDQTVWAWGMNNFGQLGSTPGASVPTPTMIPGFGGVVSIAAGDRHSIALKSDGTVWVWGANDMSQLGLGPVGTTSTPTQVPGISAVAVGAGYFHCLVVKSDGTVWAWGYGTNGQLGNGQTLTSNVPVPVTGLTGVTAVTGGNVNSLALKSDGTVWSWGASVASPINDTIPVPVPDLSGVASIAAGLDHIAVCLSNGTVQSLGRNYYNQLGVPYVQQSTVPVVISR